MCRCCVCRERGILGATGGGEGGLLPAWVLLAWRWWVLLAVTREKWSILDNEKKLVGHPRNCA
jgi:hypothetical protein